MRKGIGGNERVVMHPTGGCLIWGCRTWMAVRGRLWDLYERIDIVDTRVRLALLGLMRYCSIEVLESVRVY